MLLRGSESVWGKAGNEIQINFWMLHPHTVKAWLAKINWKLSGQRYGNFKFTSNLKSTCASVQILIRVTLMTDVSPCYTEIAKQPLSEPIRDRDSKRQKNQKAKTPRSTTIAVNETARKTPDDFLENPGMWPDRLLRRRPWRQIPRPWGIPILILVLARNFRIASLPVE